ncbi:F-box domain-containing protein [Favolaschia claudopus]|uniref:F-box domain-containing protein n=1 Tax=Favolaschia claudopus TaxID=2862362 RepID=A0AAW0AWK9_9AGAR
MTTTTTTITLAALQADRLLVTELDVESRDLLHTRAPATLGAGKPLAQERLDPSKFPVLTLPNEIVSLIFEHCAPIYPQTADLALGIHAPVPLTHVCSKWRHIALSTSALWRTLSINLSYPFHTSTRRPPTAARVETWLARAPCQPLSIDIVDDFEDLPPEVYEAVISHRDRWEYFSLQILESPPDDIFNGTMPLLRRLSLERDFRSINSIAFSDAPLLREVTLSNVSPSSIQLPWSQLTQLYLSSLFPEEGIQILSRTTNLVRCELYLVGNGIPDIPPEIQLPQLETLIVDCASPGLGRPTPGYLATCIVPALKYLQSPEGYFRAAHTSSIDVLSSFISRSGCKLQQLHLKDYHSLPPKIWLDYRTAFPSITKISLNETFV